MIEEQKTKDEGYVNVSTKVPPYVEELLKILARMRGMKVYELLQLLINGFISYAKADTTMPDEFRHLFESLKMDAAWNNAYNFASPTAQQEIEQVILVLQQRGRTGFGVTMIDKPFISEARITTSLPAIVERVLELALGFKDYVRLRKVNTELETFDPIETIRTMLDAQEIINIEQSDIEEMPSIGNYHDFGKAIEYGKRYKRVGRRTPDSVNNQQTIRFTDEDRELAESEVRDG